MTDHPTKRKKSSTPTLDRTAVTPSKKPSSMYRHTPAKARKRRTCKDPNRKQELHFMNTIQLEFQQQPEDRSGHRQEEFETTFNTQMQSVPRAGAGLASTAVDASRQMTSATSNNATMNASSSMEWYGAPREDLSLQYEGNENYPHSTFPSSNYLAQPSVPHPSYPSQPSMFSTQSVPFNADWNSTPANDYSSLFDQNYSHTGVFSTSSAGSHMPLQNQYSSSYYYLQQHQHPQYGGHGQIHAPIREEPLFSASGTRGSQEYDTLGIPDRYSPHSDIYSGSSHTGHF
ncbi:hypothetical protein L218DRAFT_99268 [Marasmius fiardii PR-910]|nr:hypothetical protein L218DRAFT_99268 [Marasmius fiardii PR-910]